MTNAIIVENLSKKFQIGKFQSSYPTMREVLSNACRAPFSKLKTILSSKSPSSSENRETLWALKDVSFEVKHGEVVGIVGGNGAGKSTLLKVLSRITRPTYGKAVLHGRLGSLLEVGTGFHPDLTGRENIFLNGAILGMRRQEIIRQFSEIVAFAEIEKFIDTPVKFYSSGMYIRLAFAVAAHLEPEILIVDEVLAVGDVRFQRKCLGKMKDIAQHGRTVLFVSHNIPAVRSFCSTAILLEEGQLKAKGDTDSVIREYLNSYSSQEGKCLWEDGKGPSNGSFRFLSVCLKNGEGSLLHSVPISQDTVIEIEYEVEKKGSQVGFSCMLFDMEGQCIFSSLNNLEAEYYGNQLSLGIYRTTCHLPGHLLNEGRFYISLVGFSAARSDPVVLDRILSFDAIDDGVLRGDFHGNFSGVIRPKLDWRTYKV